MVMLAMALAFFYRRPYSGFLFARSTLDILRCRHSESRHQKKAPMPPATTPRASSRAKSIRHLPGRGRIFASITEAIGDTPIVQLQRLPQMHGVKANILAKLEFLNPAGSVKDRIGAALIDDMERAGLVRRDR
jgi:threonine synthase